MRTTFIRAMGLPICAFLAINFSARNVSPRARIASLIARIVSPRFRTGTPKLVIPNFGRSLSQWPPFLVTECVCRYFWEICARTGITVLALSFRQSSPSARTVIPVCALTFSLNYLFAHCNLCILISRNGISSKKKSDPNARTKSEENPRLGRCESGS